MRRVKVRPQRRAADLTIDSSFNGQDAFGWDTFPLRNGLTADAYSNSQFYRAAGNLDGSLEGWVSHALIVSFSYLLCQ